MKVDLHIHSAHSFDSTLETEDIIAIANQNQLDYIAICDHNELRGAKELHNNQNIKSISGIEIDCYFNDDVIHLLGYGIDLNNSYLNNIGHKYYAELKRIGEMRRQLIEDKLNITFDMDKVIKLTHGGYPYTNVELTIVLLEDYKDHPFLYDYVYGDKKANPLANFYWDNLAIGKWGYVAMDLPHYDEVINQIHQANGVCIVAHPLVGIKKDEDRLIDLIDKGIDGLEVYSSYHDASLIDFYLEMCHKYDLLITAGSDFHGSTKPNIKIGQTYRDGKDDAKWFEKLMEKINEKNNT